MERSEKKRRSRRSTNKIITGSWGMAKYEIEDKFCKVCKKTHDLEVHHEVYPIKASKIREAIYKKKIYYLCKKCHRDLHTQNKNI